MTLIVITGILSCGIIPFFALIGWGVNLIINIFTEVIWSYWACAGVGFLIIVFTETIRSTIKDARERKCNDCVIIVGKHIVESNIPPSAMQMEREQ